MKILCAVLDHVERLRIKSKITFRDNYWLRHLLKFHDVVDSVDRMLLNTSEAHPEVSCLGKRLYKQATNRNYDVVKCIAEVDTQINPNIDPFTGLFKFGLEGIAPVTFVF